MVKVREIPTQIKSKIIRDEVHKQVNDVDAIIKELLAKKIAELKAQNPEGQQKEQEQQTNNGLLYNNLVEALDNLKTEILGNPTTETVRQVKLMLNDVLKNLKGQPTSNVKAILDLIFNFIPYTKTNKTDGELINYNDNNYVQAVAGSKTKNVEIRRLIRDIMLKFVHDNSIKYLGEDLYPKTYNEAKQYFNIEKIGQQVAEKETDENKSRLDKRQKIIDTNIRNSAEHEAKVRQQLDDQRAQVLAEKRAKKAKEDAEKQAKFEKYLDEIAQFLYDNTTALIDYINDKSVFGMVSKYIGNPRDIGLDKVASEIDYNSNITRYIQDKLSRILGVNAVNELQTKLAHTSDLTALKSKLTGTSNGLNVFNYIINELNPRTEAEVLDILKVSNDKALRKSLASKL